MLRSEAGDVQTELVVNGVGNESAVTYMLGDVARNLKGPYSDDTKPALQSHAWVRVPVEVLISDTLIHEDLYGLLTPTASVYADHDRSPRAQTFQVSESNLLPMRVSAVYLGKGPSVLHTKDIPRYPDMVQSAFDRLGWDGERFDVYRCRVVYPVMPSTVVVDIDLPEKRNKDD